MPRGSLRVSIVAVGRVKERGLRDAIDDYVARIGRYSRAEETELKDGSAAEVAERFARALGERDRTRVVALEVGGKALTSEGLARYLERAENESISKVAFLVGGSHGLPEETSRAADMKLSLSAMTLPHRIARLVLVEQIYRAFTISRGEPYDH